MNIKIGNLSQLIKDTNSNLFYLMNTFSNNHTRTYVRSQ